MIVIDGGFAEQWEADLWVVSKGEAMPVPSSRVPVEEIQFRKAKQTHATINLEFRGR